MFIQAHPVDLLELDDCVIIKRGQVEVCVSGSGCAHVVRKIIATASGGCESRDGLAALFAEEERVAIKQLIQHLIEKRILFETDTDVAGVDSEGPLDVFYWHFGTTSKRVRESFISKKVGIIGLNDISCQLVRSLEAEMHKGIPVLDDPLLRNPAFFDDNGHLQENRWPGSEPPHFISDPQQLKAQKFDCLVATCDLGSKTALQEWNKYCLNGDITFLPIVQNDLLGWVGPVVVPGETACYECVQLRERCHVANTALFRAMSEIGSDRTLARGYHNSMAVVLGEMGAIELSRFYGIGWPWLRIGVVIEVNLIAATMKTHKVLKVPTCESCRQVSRKYPDR